MKYGIGVLAVCILMAATAVAMETPAAGTTDVDKAHALVDAGKYDEATAAFEAILAEDAADIDAIAGLARIDLAYGEMDAVIDRLEKPLGKNTEHARGNLYYGIALYFKALQGIDGGKTSGYVASLFNDSELSLKRAIEADPKNLESHQYLGLVYYYQQNFPEAVKAFEAALAVNEKDAFSHYQIGETYQVQAEYETAIPHYERAAECDPTYADAFRKLGICHEFQQRIDEAAAAYTKAILAAPAYLEPYKDVWRLYGEVESDKGVAVLKEVVDANPDNTTALWYKAHFQRQAEQFDESLATFRRILELNPASTNVLLETGRIYAGREEFAEAADEYWKGLELNKAANPDLDYEKDAFFTALLGITSEYGSAQRFEDAEALLLKLADAAPSYGFVFSNLGLVYRDWDKQEKALHAYGKAAELLPYDAQVLNDYAVVLDYSFDRRDEAYVLYKRAVEISENGDALENLARFYLDKGQYEEAVRMADRGLRLEPDRMTYHRYKQRALDRLSSLQKTAGE